MVSWADFSEAAPDLARVARSGFDATLHHVVATLRADGSPRVSGTEARFFGDDIWLGCMPGSRKSEDLRRDPRLALHAAPVDLEMTTGDAKIDGRAVEVNDLDVISRYLDAVGHPGDPTHAKLFRLEIDRATITRVDGDSLVVTSWTPEGGSREIRRS